MKRNLLIKIWLLVFISGILTSKIVNAQATDTTGFFQPVLSDVHLIYAELILVDADEDGNFDASFNLSQDTVIAWGDYSACVAFYDEGFVVRDGGGFTSTNVVVPVPGEVCKFWFAINVPAMTYKTWVQTESMESPVLILEKDAAFRNTNITAINRWSCLHNPDAEPDYVRVQKVELITNSDPTLKSLTTNIGNLDPEFNPETTDYELMVPYGTTSIQIEAVANGMAANISYYDGQGNAIENGLVTFSGDGVDIEINVIALDGSEITYYVAIFVDPGAADATLSDIQLSAGALDPAFDAAVKTYSVIVPVGTIAVDVTGIANFPAATVVGNGTVTLQGGKGSGTITVTSSDGSVTDSYIVNIEEADGKNYAISLPGVDGNESNIDISGLELTSLPYTIEMWIKPNGDQAPNSGLIYNRTDNGNSGIQYASNWQQGNVGYPERLRFMTNFASDDYGITTDFIDSDVWHHVAVILTQNTRSIYLDGGLITEVKANSAYDFSAGKLYIGWDNGLNNRAFKGDIDEIRVWNDSLSAEVLDANKYEVLNGDEAGLLNYWNFDLKNSAYAIDVTSNAHNGTITGGTYVESFPRANLELDTLYISGATLKPGFNKGLTEYYVVLPIGSTSFIVNATPADNKTTVSGTGSVNIDDAGIATITVTSSDGMYTLNYNIHYVVDTELTLMHSYTFADGTAKDVVGGADGEIQGGSITDGVFTSSTEGDYIVLPSQEIALNNFPSITMEAYVTTGINDGYSMLSYFGGLSGANSYWIQLSRGGTDEFSTYSRTEIKTNGDAVNVHGPEPFEGETHHYVSIVTSDTLYWYIDGALAGSSPTSTNAIIAKIDPTNGWLCYGGWNDPTWIGSIYEFNIYSGVMDEQTIAIRSVAIPAEDETSNATLSLLTVDGDTITGFSPYTLSYSILMPSGSTVPTIAATPKNAGATAVVTATTGIPGTATVLVTAADGTTTNTYTIYFTVEGSLYNDATLSDLAIDGSTVDGFDPATLTYDVVLIAGTTVVPTVAATTTNANAAMVITDATGLPGSTTVTVTAEDGTTIATYTINFSVESGITTVGAQSINVFPTISSDNFTVEVELSDDATLSDLTVDGITVTGFDAAILTYDVVLAAGTTVVPTVAATTTDANATTVITDATSLPGSTSVTVTAEDGTTTSTYTINFSVESGITTAGAQSIKVFPTISSGNFTVQTQGGMSTISIYNITGKMVEKITTSAVETKVSAPKAGMYILVVKNEDTVQTFKVIKKNK